MLDIINKFVHAKTCMLEIDELCRDLKKASATTVELAKSNGVALGKATVKPPSPVLPDRLFATKY